MATFTFLRHHTAKEEAESTFIRVHESTTGPSQIEQVDALREGGSVIVTIHRKGGITDTVISNLNETDTASGNRWTLKGRLAYGSDHGGVRKGVLLSGVQLIGGVQEILAPAPARGRRSGSACRGRA
mgnify:FL=1